MMYGIEMTNPRGEKFIVGKYRTRFWANYNIADMQENACDGFTFRIVEVNDD